MSKSVRLTTRSLIESSLKEWFGEGMWWPIDPASLAALTDLGLSNHQIGEYFSVGPDDVQMLREHYRFGPPSV